MTSYQLSFTNGRGDRAASGTVFCSTDAEAMASARRLLRTMRYFDRVEVRDSKRTIAALDRCDLEAA